MDDAYQPETRAPPPTGPPPAYARVLNRVYPYSLRPILLFSTVISFIYLVLLGAGNFKDAGHKEETGKLKLFDIVCGALFMGAAAVEVFGFFAVYTQRLPLARTYSWASLLAFAAVIASELLGIVVTFTLKTDIVNVCTARHTGRTESDGGLLDISPSNNGTLTEAQARTYCESQWSSDRTWTIIWLIVTIFVGTFFVSFSFGYVRQLLDPLSVRERPAATFWGRRQQQAAPSAQYGQGAPYDTDAYYQTPYNGGHYANNPYSYPPPPGPPPPGHVPPHYGQQDRMPPTYDGVNRPSSVDLDDAKRAPYGHQQAGPFSDDHQVTDGPRPESSRGVHAGGDEDDDERRGSFDTLKGDDTDAHSKSHNKSPRDDDYVPRI